MGHILLIGASLIEPLKVGHAYLDPGSGSIIIQVILAGLLGAAFIIRSYWAKIKGFFRSRFTKNNNSDTE